MSRYGARVLLAVSCLVAAAATFQSYRFTESHTADRARLLELERTTGALLATLTEMRAAQMAYLATGQGPDFWMRRASELSAQLGDGIARLRNATTTADAGFSLNVATVALSDLVQLDNRARQALQSDQRYLASDLVFADAVTGSQKIADALGAARDSERMAVEAALGRDRVLQLALFPATVALVLVSAWVAGRSGRQKAAPKSEAEELAQMLRELPPPVKSPGITAATTPPVATPPARPVAAAPTGTPVPATPPPATPSPAFSASLSATADLCVDLARVMDARDLPAMLQRAARTLDATGIIVWVVDTDGATLAPALTHGYSDRVLSRLGTLDVNADNVTSLSFRSMRPQSMAGAGRNGDSSAIAVPLVTTEGCNGVFAAEVPGTRAADDSIAVARILAAQLATMLSPVEPPARRAAEA